MCEGEFGDRINAMRKYIVSRTLTETRCNAAVIDGELAAGVGRLKAQDGGDLLIYRPGSEL
jgi:hypothetical protein